MMNTVRISEIPLVEPMSYQFPFKVTAMATVSICLHSLTFDLQKCWLTSSLSYSSSLLTASLSTGVYLRLTGTRTRDKARWELFN